MPVFSEDRIDIKRNIAANNTVLALKKHIANYKLTIPTEQSARLIEPCSDVNVSQKLFNRSQSTVGRTKTFRNFINCIKEMKDNLKYNESVHQWQNFYVFPTIGNAEKYAKEERIEFTSICNLNKASCRALLTELWDLSQISSHKSKVKFISGTTGVGKTTFLKYLTKTQKDRSLKRDVILSRVKFSDVQNAIDGLEEKDRLKGKKIAKKFELEIMNCIARDILDSYKRSNNKKMFPNRTRFQKFDDQIQSLLELLADTGSWSEVKLEQFLGSVSDDPLPRI